MVGFRNPRFWARAVGGLEIPVGFERREAFLYVPTMNPERSLFLSTYTLRRTG